MLLKLAVISVSDVVTRYDDVCSSSQRGFLQLPLLSTLESLYVMGIVPLEVYNSFLHPLLGLTERLPFLPLMLTSVYCAVGVCYCWLRFYLLTFDGKVKKVKTN